MSFEVRCPECRAKLRLDDEPAAVEAIECPRCGNHFEPAAAPAAAPKKKKAKESAPGGKPGGEKTAVKERKPKAEKAGKAKADPTAPKKKRAKKKKSNKTVLAFMLIGALVILTGIGLTAYVLFGASGKVEGMLVYVPADCNIVRGVNAGHISKYAGYRSELDKAMTGPIGDCWLEVASGMGLSKADGETPEYAVQGKVKAGAGSGTLFVYRTRKPFDPKALGAALGGAEAQAGGQSYFQLPGKNGLLNRAAVFAPSDRIIVVVPAGPRQADLVQKSIAGKTNPEGSFWNKMGKTGRKVSNGSTWILIRAEGDLQNYIRDLVKPVEGDFKQLADQANKSPTFGMWTSFGAKITFGAAIQCESVEAASALADFFKTGPLGQGDETVEPPNSLKTAFSSFKSKDMSEFRSNLKFGSTGECAYLESRMTHKDKASSALSAFGNGNAGDAPGAGGGGPRGFGGFGPGPGG